MKSFWPILKFSSTFCNSVDDSNFPEHPGAILEMSVQRTSRFSPNRPFETLHSGRSRAGPPHAFRGNKCQDQPWCAGRIWESHISFSRNDSWITHFYRTAAVICHQNVPGKLRVFHSFQELARPNANKNIHFVNSHFCRGLALLYYYCFSHSQKSYAWFFEKLKPGYLIFEFVLLSETS